MKPKLLGRKRGYGKLKLNATYLLMAFPGLLFLLINNYLPMIGVIIPFKEVDYSLGFLNSPYADPWYKNFLFFLKSPDAVRIVRNTLFYNFLFIVTGTLISIMIAIFLNEVANKKLMKFYQSTLLFPSFVTWVIVGYLFIGFFSPARGMLINDFFKSLGLPQDVYSRPGLWNFILPFLNIWKGAGAGALIYFGTILSINDSLFEAAAIDGATKLKQLRYVTFPHLVPVIIILTLLALGRIFYSDFGLFWFLAAQKPALTDTTTTIEVYVFRALINLGNPTLAAATGLLQSTVGFFLVLGSNLLVRRVNPDYSIF